MARIIYFLYPTKSGGVFFQNSFLDETLRGSHGLTRNLGSVIRPEIDGDTLYLQGESRKYDFSFVSISCKPYYLDRAIEDIENINKGVINV